MNKWDDNTDDILSEYLKKDKIREPKFIDTDSFVEISTGKPMPRAASSILRDEQNPASGKSAQNRKSRPRPDGTQKKNTRSPEKNKKSNAKKSKTEKSRRPDARAVSQQKRPGNAQVKRSAPIQDRTVKGRRVPNNNGRKKENVLNTYIDKSRKIKSEKIDKDYHEGIKKGRSKDEISRSQSRRKKRNNNSKIAIAVLLTVFIVFGAILTYFYASGKPVVNINIEGSSVYTKKQIKAASGITVGDNIFRISKRRTGNTISRVLPYIKSVDVKLQLPDTVLLKINETDDYYMINGNKKYFCVDKDGKILSTKKKKLNDGQYKLKGFDNEQEYNESETYSPKGKDKERFEKARAIIKILEANGLKKANVIELGDLNDITIVYDSRVKIYLGDAQSLEEKLSISAQVISIEVGKTTTGYIEARYSNRVFFKEGSMTQQ